MVKLKFYEEKNLPESLRWQILSFIRVQWSEGFTGQNQFRDWISRDLHPVYFIFEHQGLLISCVSVVWKYLEHNGQKFKTYGLSGVFTYPSFRKQGYGSKLVNKAKEYIEKQDGDIVLFTSMQMGFYEKAGFIPIKNRLLVGNPKSPRKSPENVYMIFLSKKGKTAQKDFEEIPIYFGEDSW